MKATTKINYKKLLLGCLILGLICLTLTNTCKRQPLTPSVTIETKPIEERVDRKLERIKRDSLIIDSLLHLKRKVVNRYKTKTDSIYIVAPDTCKDYIKQITDEHLKTDSVNNIIIKAQSVTINDYSMAVKDLNDIVKIQNKQLNDSSTVITQLKKDVKKERRKGKLKAVLSGLTGALAGFGLGSLN